MPSKIGSTKFVQNWVSNSLDIPDMDKCCLDKCHHDMLSVKDVPRNLPLKGPYNRIRKFHI